jgi:N-acyl-D-amino-acid deacylase
MHSEPEDLKAVMKHPRTVMTFSDSGAHVSQIVDCSIQTHLLAHWVRDRQDFTLEEAVRMLTLVPAMAWEFADRGLVREGLVADLNVFDPDRVGPAMPTLEHDLPGGARRLIQRATGFRATVVGGQVVLRDGEHTGALPGALLRG